jgi:hypothetical protein
MKSSERYARARGKAYQVIECCAAMKSSERYARAKSILEQRFGNDFVITEAWVDKVTGGLTINPNEAKGVQELADDLRSCYGLWESSRKLTIVAVS